MNPGTSLTAKAERSSLGFWTYVMTDCILFATLFAAYAVLHGNTFGGPSGKDIFDMPYVLAETLLLLTSSLTCGLMLVSAKHGMKAQALAWMAATFVLGAAFVGLELNEFAGLVAEGHSWSSSAFLSSFFTLVGTHGLHISVGLLWMIVLGLLILRRGLTANTKRRLMMFGIFWHFLDIVWVFIFAIVYLMGAAS